MAKKSFNIFEKERKKAIERVKAMNDVNIEGYLKKVGAYSLIGRVIDQKKLKEAALADIDVNYITLLQSLEYLKKNPLISEDNSERIQIKVRSVQHHFKEIKDIPDKLEEGMYSPVYVQNKFPIDEILKLN